MDGRNNPQNTQNRQLTNASSAELNHILQNGVTPEQFAENARQLEHYSRLNAMALQVHLQRQTQLAEQRRQDELRLIQMAQQLATGTQQQQFQRRILPTVPQMTHGHQPLPAQQAVATSIANNRNVPTQTHNHGPPYHRAHTSNIPSQHGQYYRFRVEQPLPIVQHQQPHLPLNNGSAHAVNQNVYHQHETVRISHAVGGAGAVATSTLPAPQNVQRAPAFIPQKPQYPQYSGAATSSQAIPGQGDGSGVTADHGLRSLYPSWVEVCFPSGYTSSYLSGCQGVWR
ncbi:hypothetical protein BJV78DRAFT_484834 [Lactifluus subvellereus]|nr:hypothetical protein BJV78DRAFT_484834 [Lactifluus subvellereus]